MQSLRQDRKKKGRMKTQTERHTQYCSAFIHTPQNNEIKNRMRSSFRRRWWTYKTIDWYNQWQCFDTMWLVIIA